MKIAVLGCGAIGGLFLGYLSTLNDAGESVKIFGVTRSYQKEAISKEGLCIEGIRGKFALKNIDVDIKLRERADLTILAVKMDSLKDVICDNIKFIQDSIILTTQNGIGAEDIVKEYFPEDKIITGIVMFGSTFYPPNRVVHNFNGGLVIGNIFPKNIPELEKFKELLNKVFPTVILQNIKGAKFLKVLINLNNCIPACLGLSMQEAFSDLRVSETAIKLLKEAYSIIKQSGLELESLPSYPKERIDGLVNGDIAQAAGIFSQIMQKLSKEPLYGSILQSIQKKKKSEIDYINGAIIKLAENKPLDVFLNRKIIQMVHNIEEGRAFYGKEEFIKTIKLR